jgi:hypothetical protein
LDATPSPEIGDGQDSESGGFQLVYLFIPVGLMLLGILGYQYMKKNR